MRTLTERFVILNDKDEIQIGSSGAAYFDTEDGAWKAIRYDIYHTYYMYFGETREQALDKGRVLRKEQPNRKWAYEYKYQGEVHEFPGLRQAYEFIKEKQVYRVVKFISLTYKELTE